MQLNIVGAMKILWKWSEMLSKKKESW